MFKSRLLFIFALPFALITTLAYGQVFLGNVFRLGTSTDAAKPAASATNKGGLLFISDGDAGTGVAGSIAYSNGSSWLPVLGGGGSSGSTNFWYDAGSGNIFAQEAIYNPDGGVNIRLSSGVNSSFLTTQPATAVAISTSTYPTVGLGFGSLGSSTPLQGTPYAFTPVDNQYAFAVVNADNTYGAPGLLLWNQSNGGGFGQAPVGAAFVTGTAGNTTYYGKLTAGGSSFGYATGLTVSVQPARNFGFRNDNTGTLWWTTEANTGEFNFVGVTSGNDAIQLNNGARVHLGSGTNDYAFSDGTQWTWGGPPLLPSYATGSLPASSNGGLAFDSTVGQPKYYSDGGWQSFGGSSGSTNFWYDGGAGLITANEAIYWRASGSGPTTTAPKIILAQGSGGAVAGPSLEWQNSAGTPIADMAYSDFNGNQLRVGVSIRLRNVGPSDDSRINFSRENDNYQFGSFGGSTAPYGLYMPGTSGENGLRFFNAGTRIDMSNGGSDDYFTGDGTGIETPSYWESTRAVTSGPGIIAPSVQASGTTFSNFTSTNRTALGAGNILANTTTNELWQSTSSGFKPLGQAHNVIDRQTMSTRVMGTGKNAFPEISERIRCDSFGGTGAEVQMYWDRIAISTTTGTSGRTYQQLLTTTDASSRAKGYTACSSASTTLYTSVYAGAPNAASYTSFCQAIGGVTTSNTVAWVLLANAEPGADATTLTSAAFGFRYASSIDGNWYACYYNGSNSCTSTGIAVGTSTEQVLCAYQIGTNLLVWTINGVVVHTAAAVSTLSNASPVITLDTTTTSATALNVGAMTVESL
jgi:hypothetical protein